MIKKCVTGVDEDDRLLHVGRQVLVADGEEPTVQDNAHLEPGVLGQRQQGRGAAERVT